MHWDLCAPESLVKGMGGWATNLYSAIYGILALWAVQRSRPLLPIRLRCAG